MFKVLTNFEYEAFAFRDNWKTITLAVTLGMILWLTLGWIITNVVGQVQIVIVYGWLAAGFFLAYFINILKKHIPKLQPFPFGTVSLGWNIKTVALISLVGLGLGYFLVMQHLTVALPLDVVYKTTVNLMDFVYKVVMSPIIEEMFRAVVLISSALITWRFSKNWMLSLLMGLLVSSFAFGIFHWLAYQQEFAFIGAAIIFGLIAGILMILSKSILPSIAFHFANNQLIFSEGDPTIVIVLAALVAAILAIVFFRRWG